jgi:hypothetical protein
MKTAFQPLREAHGTLQSQSTMIDAKAFIPVPATTICQLLTR